MKTEIFSFLWREESGLTREECFQNVLEEVSWGINWKIDVVKTMTKKSFNAKQYESAILLGKDRRARIVQPDADELPAWAKAESPAVLQVGGCGPCLGISLNDPQCTLGYAGHFFAWESDMFDEMMTDAKKSYPKPETISVTATGMVDEGDARMIVRREKLIEHLQSLGFSKIETHFHPDGIFGITLDLQQKIRKIMLY